MNIKKLFDFLPTYPHYKMNVFSGTNTKEEGIKVRQNLRKKNLVQGESIKEYESLISSKMTGENNVYTFASGRMGFYSILKSIDIKKGDEVIIPSYTCIVVVNAILYAGAKPVYCDIRKDDFNIDVSQIESLITDKTKILYAQHTFGQMCDVYQIKQLAEKYGLLVVEDVALSLGAKDNGKYAGTIGDFGYTSSDRSKVINTGLGGIVFVNNEEYQSSFDEFYEKVPYLNEKYTRKIAKTFLINNFTLHPKYYWFGKFLNVLLTKSGFLVYFLDEHKIDKDEIQNYPYPARLSNILANIGVSQVLRLEENIKSRKLKAQKINEILKIYSKEYIEDEKNIFLRYSFLVKNRDYWEERFSSKIDLSIWFKSITSGKSDNFQQIYYQVGTNKISEYTTQHIFNIPTHDNIKVEKLEKLLLELKASGDIITKEQVL